MSSPMLPPPFPPMSPPISPSISPSMSPEAPPTEEEWALQLLISVGATVGALIVWRILLYFLRINVETFDEGQYRISKMPCGWAIAFILLFLAPIAGTVICVVHIINEGVSTIQTSYFGWVLLLTIVAICFLIAVLVWFWDQCPCCNCKPAKGSTENGLKIRRSETDASPWSSTLPMMPFQLVVDEV